MKVIRRQLGYLFMGFIVWFPIGIVILVGDYIFGTLDSTGKDFLDLFLPERFLKFGLGFLVWVLVFYLSGVLFRKTNIGAYLSGIPILGMFVRTSGETMTIERLAKLKPCLFLLSPTCPGYGWIIASEKVRLQEDKAGFQLIDLYYPNVPTIITGQVFSVRKETVIRLGNPSRELIDILLYGLRKPEDLQYLPWEDETPEQFRERAVRFGLLIPTLTPMNENPSQ